MDKLIKGITTLAPFLAPYPSWVKGAFALWVLTTAVLALGLILARPPQSPPIVDPKPTGAGQGKDVWLLIDGVEFFGAKPGAQIQLTADVNGTRFAYPSKADVQWLEVGPAMAGQIYPLPPTNEHYIISFEAKVRSPAHGAVPAIHSQLKSVKEIIINPSTDLPYEGRYILHTFNPNGQSRSSSAEAQVKFRISLVPH